jgi:hypothetical protein
MILCLVVPVVSAQEKTPELGSPFNRLKVSGNIYLVLVPSPDQKLESPAWDSLNAPSVEMEGKTLILKYKTELSDVPALEMKLYYRELSGIEVNRGGRVQSADSLVTGFLELDALSGGKIELVISSNKLDARVTQGSDIILYGSTGEQTVDAYTWGNYLGYDLVSTDAIVKAATGAQVKVHVTGLLDANATSGAFVGFTGDPEQTRMKRSLGGEISAESP